MIKSRKDSLVSQWMEWTAKNNVPAHFFSETESNFRTLHCIIKLGFSALKFCEKILNIINSLKKSLVDFMNAHEYFIK